MMQIMFSGSCMQISHSVRREVQSIFYINLQEVRDLKMNSKRRTNHQLNGYRVVEMSKKMLMV